MEGMPRYVLQLKCNYGGRGVFCFDLVITVLRSNLFFISYFKAPAEKTKAAVKTAVKTGYRMIDCANDYDNEHVIGEAFQELFKEGVVVRYF